MYNTTDGKVLVENELLNFIVVKMRTLAHDEIVLVVSNNFSSEWIEESKRLLFDMCPTSTRCVKHKGPQKDNNNIKDCLMSAAKTFPDLNPTIWMSYHLLDSSI